MIRYAKLDTQVLDVRGSSSQVREASIDKFAEFDNYRTEDGYLYARIRAISSRVNKNHDGWPSIELAGNKDTLDRHLASAHSSFTVEADRDQDQGFSTFLGKPIFIDHNNSNPQRARGVVVDAKLHVEPDTKTASDLDPYYATAEDDFLPPTWVELLLEVDAKTFPKFAKALVDGSKDPDSGLDGFSMGADISHSRCSHCDNIAYAPDQFCKHVKKKGKVFPFVDKTGKKRKKQSFEFCHGIQFFELSCVFDPADDTALTREVVSSLRKEADSDELPQNDKTKVPEEVNTLRDEHLCPVCGSEMDGPECDVCSYMENPEGFGNPDMEKAQEQNDQLRDQQNTPEETPYNADLEDQDQNLPPANKPMKEQVSHSVTNDNRSIWSVKLDSREASQINKREFPITPNRGRVSDRPNEEVIRDGQPPLLPSKSQPKNFEPKKPDQEPKTSAVRKQRRSMSNRRTAADPLPAARPDVNTDVGSQGGVMDANNESGSQADSQVTVSDIGSTPTDAVSAEETETVDQGNEYSKNVEQIPTKTWTDGNQHAPVGDQPFPPSDEGVKKGPQPRRTNWHVVAYGPAVEGVQPSDPVGDAEQRIDVTDVDYDVPLQRTETWTGTDGNGVLRQQDPSTGDAFPRTEDGVRPRGSSTGSQIRMADLQLADKEIEMGMTDPSQKYARIAELSQQSEQTVSAYLDQLNRVRTAGLAKDSSNSAPTKSMKMPSLSKAASREASSSTEDDYLLDSAVFSR